MKKFAALFFIIASLLLTACGDDVTGVMNQTVLSVTEKDGTVTNYVECTPMKLYPVEAFVPEGETAPKVYVSAGGRDYYKVSNQELTDFLCYGLTNGNKTYYYLVRNENIPEPTLAEFEPIAADICDSTGINITGHLFSDKEYLPDGFETNHPSEDTHLCRLIVDTFAQSEGETVPEVEFENLNYLRMLSAEYPGLYYQLSFFQYNGNYYLRDSSANKTVICPRDIVVRVLSGS